MPDRPIDPKQITLSGEVEGGEPEFGQAQAVFFGIDISWRPRISDLNMNTSVAESWEDVFSSWEIQARSVHLRSRRLRYRVTFRDGAAQFMLDGATAWDMAIEHTATFVEKLHENDRSTARVRATVQHLVPVEDEFDDLVEKLVDRVFNADFYHGLGETMDIAYVVDVIRDGVQHHVAIGPLRAHEVQQRVAAQIVDHVPEQSIFTEITAFFPSTDDEIFAAADVLTELRTFGKSLAEGLTK